MPNDDGRPLPAPGATVLTNCPNCGASLNADAKFCSNCGTRTQQYEAFTAADAAGGATTPVTETPSPAPAAASEPAAAAAAAPNSIIARLSTELAGRYTVERELGRGGMATVYLAKDVKHGRDVAIKVLHPELSASIGGERFEREIRLVANLQHPNVLGLYDSGNASGLLYYVMPFVDGESLRDKLNREGQLSIDDALRIGLDVASALGYAHGKGIIHRDIKPENILLSGELTLVADFGIAKAASEANQQKLTQTGMAVGTPLYMAPEQAGGESVGPTADLYSLGCMLYEMLAGEPPFTGKNPVAIMARHAMEQVPSIRIVRSSVPAEVEEAIFASMGKVPADRPQTAAQFCELLGAPMGSTSTMRVRGRTSIYGAVAPPKPWWKKTAVLVTVPAVLILAGAGAWYSLRGQPEELVGFAPNRIAVLYFADQSRDSSWTHVADGLTESLIDELRQVRSLDVITPNGVAPFRGQELARDSIGRALSAGTLVEGSVEPITGDRLRVQVRLVDGNSGADLGNRASFELPAGNLLALRDTLTVRVAALVRQRVGEEVRLQTLRAGTSNERAWSLVTLAQTQRKEAGNAWRAGRVEEVDRRYRVADSLLAEAERQDPAWTEPAVIRAQIAARRAAIAGDRLEIARWTEVGLQHAGRALQKERQDAAALEARGLLRYQRYFGQVTADPAESAALLRQAEQDFREAVEVQPSRANAWYLLSHLLYMKLDVVDAKLAARRAYEEDAFLESAPQVVWTLFMTSYLAQQFSDAVQWCELGRRRFTENPRFVECQLMLLASRAREPDANRAWTLVGELEPLTPPARWEYQRRWGAMYTAIVLARANQADSARRVIARSRGNPEIDPDEELVRLEAVARATLGENEEALRLLRRYLATNPEPPEIRGKVDYWWWGDLRNDPRYKQLIGV